MKKIFTLVSLTLLFISSQTVAQTENKDSVMQELGNALNKIFNTKVYMDLDTTLFDTHQNNMYFNEADNAMIMTMVVPQSFAKAEEHFNKESKKDGYKLLEKKKFTHNGRDILYQKGFIKKKGKKAYMYLYAINVTEGTIIFFNGLHMDGDDKKYFPAIERAALSASITD